MQVLQLLLTHTLHTFATLLLQAVYTTVFIIPVFIRMNYIFLLCTSLLWPIDKQDHSQRDYLGAEIIVQI